jgi:hypothetical protein
MKKHALIRHVIIISVIFVIFLPIPPLLAKDPLLEEAERNWDFRKGRLSKSRPLENN